MNDGVVRVHSFFLVILIYYPILFFVQYELLSLALQGPTCDKIKIDLKQIFETSDNEDTKSMEMDKLSSNDDLTQQKLKEIKNNLAKFVTSEQTQHAMEILNGFRVGANEHEQKAALVSVFVLCHIY